MIDLLVKTINLKWYKIKYEHPFVYLNNRISSRYPLPLTSVNG